MDKQLSKRAIEGRRWRVQARQKRKLNTIIAKYIEVKHTDIHNMCVNFYGEVVKNYSELQDVTKTTEFQQLLETTVSEQAETAQAETAQAETAQAETAQTETAQAETAQTETAQAETAQTETAQAETARAETAQAETAQAETAQAKTAQAETAQPETAQAVNSTIGDIAEDEDINNRIENIINNIVKEFENVEPSIFEGLDLNSEDEFGTLLDTYNIDNSW